MFQAPIALGTIANLEQDRRAALAPAHHAAVAAVRQASVKYVDETGWKPAVRKRWLGTFVVVEGVEPTNSRVERALRRAVASVLVCLPQRRRLPLRGVHADRRANPAFAGALGSAHGVANAVRMAGERNGARIEPIVECLGWGQARQQPPKEARRIELGRVARALVEGIAGRGRELYACAGVLRRTAMKEKPSNSPDDAVSYTLRPRHGTCGNLCRISGFSQVCRLCGR
jgi:hypothetical protein